MHFLLLFCSFIFVFIIELFWGFLNHFFLCFICLLFYLFFVLLFVSLFVRWLVRRRCVCRQTAHLWETLWFVCRYSNDPLGERRGGGGCEGGWRSVPVSVFNLFDALYPECTWHRMVKAITECFWAFSIDVKTVGIGAVRLVLVFCPTFLHNLKSLFSLMSTFST